MPVRLLIADDDVTIRSLLRRLLESHGWEVCAECADGLEAAEKTLSLSPDVVILDLAMPKRNGLETARQILLNDAGQPILLLTVQSVSKQLEEAARGIGFRGAVSKANGREVITAIETLLRGEHFFVIDQVMDDLPGPSEQKIA